MFFTQEDYRKIEKWLLANSRKDTEFAGASLPLKGNETVAFVQDGKNVNVFLKDLIEQIFLLGVSDFLNVTDKYGESRISLTQAIQLIPYKSRKIGQVITFLDEDGEWKLFQFQGERVNQWNNATLWVDLIKGIQGISIIDSEDITATVDNLNQTSLTFADKNYNTTDYSGLGRVYLRKNIQSVVNPNTEITYSTNLLTQQMLNKENTIYVLQYDYSLNYQTISIPEGSILVFEGGDINNGTLNCNSTIIVGKFRGNATIAGTYSFQDAQADEEDITQNQSSVLKFKDRKYEPDKYSGLGRKILRRRVIEIEDPVYGTQEKNLLLQEDFDDDNTVYVVRYDFTLNGQDIILPDNSYIEYEGGSISDGNIIDKAGGFNRVILKKNILNDKNILTKDMVSKPNTIYEIRYDFDLNGQEITIPENCVLQFEGGSVNNGIIRFTNTILTGEPKIITSVFGTLDNDFLKPEWFGAKGDGITNDSVAFQICLNLTGNITLSNTTYLVSGDLQIKSNTSLIGENTKIITRDLNNYIALLNGVSKGAQADAVDNFLVDGVTFDQSGEFTYNKDVNYSYIIFKIYKGSNITFRNCTFHWCGVNCLQFNGINVNNIDVDNNIFYFTRLPLKNYDRSCIYISANSYKVRNNKIYSTNKEYDYKIWGGIDCWNTECEIYNNIIDDCIVNIHLSTPLEGVVRPSNIKNTKIYNNSSKNGRTAVKLWPYAGEEIKNVFIYDNNFGVEGALGITGSGLDPKITSNVSNIFFYNNIVTGLGRNSDLGTKEVQIWDAGNKYIFYSINYGVCENINIYNNKFYNIAGGIFGNFKFTSLDYPCSMSNIRIENNYISCLNLDYKDSEISSNIYAPITSLLSIGMANTTDLKILNNVIDVPEDLTTPTPNLLWFTNGFVNQCVFLGNKFTGTKLSFLGSISKLIQDIDGIANINTGKGSTIQRPTTVYIGDSWMDDIGRRTSLKNSTFKNVILSNPVLHKYKGVSYLTVDNFSDVSVGDFLRINGNSYQVGQVFNGKIFINSFGNPTSIDSVEFDNVMLANYNKLIRTGEINDRAVLNPKVTGTLFWETTTHTLLVYNAADDTWYNADGTLRAKVVTF